MSSVSDKSYITIQGWMRTELNLSGNDLMVYAIIYGFSQTENQMFTGSRQYLADWCGATRQGIDKNLKNLIDRGLISKKESVVNNVKIVAYHTTELTPPVNSVDTPCKLSCHNNIDNKLNNKIIPKGKVNLSSDENPLSEFESKMYSEDVKEKRKREQVADKPKKLSLWDKCVQHIEEFTDDEKLREALKQYLTVRLAMRDKPLYPPQWKALLNKIRTLHGDPVNIVLQATQGGWMSFYDEKVIYTNGRTAWSKPNNITFGEHSGMSSDKVSNAEWEEMMKNGQKF